ncbi:hypothetical protein [Cellulosilyticum lentocellum]|uniref:KOW domain-containing protein n=1 Tax=Cellulosilyticum lentocellum (strain ATCC 49066 / DSM 5427 / NCIMB 11756 / RHM5) TaxID=642492 RepID=F2JQV0_CELLD|nr:hypothetical protein [Cellulosilyticum lentocellum]ADZ82695.1 hypothetical protein Clole_0963 [Cellulosilyticum lentocellum DSM 5427]
MINEENVIFFKTGQNEEIIRKGNIVEIITPVGQDNITGRVTSFSNGQIYLDCSELYNADLKVLNFNEVRSIEVVK